MLDTLKYSILPSLVPRNAEDHNRYRFWNSMSYLWSKFVTQCLVFTFDALYCYNWLSITIYYKLNFLRTKKINYIPPNIYLSYKCKMLFSYSLGLVEPYYSLSSKGPIHAQFRTSPVFDAAAHLLSSRNFLLLLPCSCYSRFISWGGFFKKNPKQCCVYIKIPIKI